jgi:hypothetical protein
MCSAWRARTWRRRRHRRAPHSAAVGGRGLMPHYWQRLERSIVGLSLSPRPRAVASPPRADRHADGERQVHDLLLRRHSGVDFEWCHDGRVSVSQTLAGVRTRSRLAVTMAIAFASPSPSGADCEAIPWAATTGGIDSNNKRDLMVESCERRFGLVDKLPSPIEWLSDNGSPGTASDTRTLAKLIGQGIGPMRAVRRFDPCAVRSGSACRTAHSAPSHRTGAACHSYRSAQDPIEPKLGACRGLELGFRHFSAVLCSAPSSIAPPMLEIEVAAGQRARAQEETHAARR